MTSVKYLSGYQLCEHMLPACHQLELEMRLYLTQMELTSAG